MKRVFRKPPERNYYLKWIMNNGQDFNRSKSIGRCILSGENNSKRDPKLENHK